MDPAATFQALALQLAWGADEALQDAPVDRLEPERPHTAPSPAAIPLAPAVPSTAVSLHTGTAARAALLAEQADSLETLRSAVGQLDLGLRDTAIHAVFADGPPCGIAVLTDAPGAEDDSTGRPLSGPEGVYFDRMLASIGMGRPALFVLPFVFWRPPGGRPPTGAEIEACLPFVRRALAFARPRALLVFAGPPAAALLGRASARGGGTRRDLVLPGVPDPVPTFVMPSPASCRADSRRRKEAWTALRGLVRIALSELDHRQTSCITGL